jgi:hypothetical protein
MYTYSPVSALTRDDVVEVHCVSRRDGVYGCMGFSRIVLVQKKIRWEPQARVGPFGTAST